MENEIQCPVCGQLISSKSVFCMYCGASINAAPNPSQQVNAQQPPQQGYQQQGNQRQNYQQQGYDPQAEPVYGYSQMPQGNISYSNPNPVIFDPRFKEFQTSRLQPGQNELVRCSAVSKCYGNTYALNALELVIGSGKVIGLLGPNGSGKTTLIKLLCGLLTPTTGSITINGMEVGTRTKALVSYLPDRTYIPEWMRVREILDYFSDFYSDFRRPLAEAMLNDMHINQEAVMKTLSKGNQEKVQLVLVMSRDALLYLLDEPIAGVDPVARDFILDTIIRMHNPNSSVIISTHLIMDIEPVLNEVIMIKYGSLVLQGDADQLRNTFGKSLNDIFKEVFAGC